MSQQPPDVTISVSRQGTNVRYRRTSDTEVARAAGFMFICDDLESKYPSVLLVRRSESCLHYPNTWASPGGSIERGESSLLGAVRECCEEIGFDPRSQPSAFRFTESLGVSDAFETFVMFVRAEFECTLNHEHTAYQWARLNKLPDDMHPNALKVINEYKLNY